MSATKRQSVVAGTEQPPTVPAMPSNVPTTDCTLCVQLNTHQLNHIATLSRAAAAVAATEILGRTVTEHAVRMHRDHLKLQARQAAPALFLNPEAVGKPAPKVPAVLTAAPAGAPSAARLDIDGDTATVTTGVVAGHQDEELREVFVRFGKDHRNWELVNGTVRESMWEAQTPDGIQVLHSYRASFRRRETPLVPDSLVEQWQRTLMQPRTIFQLQPVDGGGVTYVVIVADPQLGKEGTQQAVANWRGGLERHLQRIVRLRLSGVNVVRVALCFLGDEHEGVCNNYGNQPHTVELDLSSQIELDFSLRIWSLDRLLTLGLPVSVVSVVSNHGEFTRNGGKDPVTTKYDNSSTMVMRQVRMLFDRSPDADRISWHIADDDPDVIVDLSGTVVSFSHGHIAKGKGASAEQRAKNAFEKQLLGRTAELMSVQVIVSAHYHHFYMLQDRDRTFFGCPALEAEKSSKYMLDHFGVWSRPGMLGLLVGENCGPLGWAEPAVL